MRAGATGGSRVMPLTALPLAAQKRPNPPLSGQTPAGVTHARLGVSEARRWCYRCNISWRGLGPHAREIFELLRVLPLLGTFTAG